MLFTKNDTLIVAIKKFCKLDVVQKIVHVNKEMGLNVSGIDWQTGKKGHWTRNSSYVLFYRKKPSNVKKLIELIRDKDKADLN